MNNNPLLKQIFHISLYFLLPAVFFAILYSMMSFYYLDFDPHKWSESARFLMSGEGLAAIIAGAGCAGFINRKKH